ncbi:MAG: hypothetical protein WEA10_01375 [Actinomycetota bacterium]
MMFGIEVRNQRPLWIASSALFFTGVIVTLVLASNARESAEISAAASAQRAVQEILVPELTPSDLAQQVTGPRFEALDALVTKRLLSAGPTDVVRLFSPEATVVFSTDRADVGTRETSERDRLARVIRQGRESVVGSSAFRVFVPLRLEAGGPVLGVAELQQPYETLWAAASRPWRIGTIVCALLCLGSLALVALGFRGASARGIPKTPAAAATGTSFIEEPVSAPDSDALEAARSRAAHAEQIAEQTNRRLAAVHVELDQVRKQAATAEPTGPLQTDAELEDLRERLRFVESERDAATGRLERALVAADEAAGQDTAADNPHETELERQLAQTEAARADLERHAIKLERRAADSETARAQTQRMLAAAERSEGVDPQLTAQVAQADAARVAAERRAAQAEQRAIMAEGRSATAEHTALEATDRAGTAERELEDLHERVLADRQERADTPTGADGDVATQNDEALRELQERLHHTSDQLGLLQERARAAERDLGAATERIQELESTQRREKLQDALRHLRANGEQAEVPLEDRRAAAPFRQQLSLDARTSLAAIRGLLLAVETQPGSEAAARVDKLSTHARKLEQVVTDLLDADRLARGDIHLAYRHTDLNELVRRVVEEAGIDPAEHPVQVHAEPVEVTVDPIRVEEIVSGLLNGAVERTKASEPIVVRVERSDDGALISVEDDEPSSDANMSPVVARFADVHGGWAIVEGRQGGGSAFRVFLPDHAADAAPGAEGDDVTIMLPDPSHHGLPAS